MRSFVATAVLLLASGTALGQSDEKITRIIQLLEAQKKAFDIVDGKLGALEARVNSLETKPYTPTPRTEASYVKMPTYEPSPKDATKAAGGWNQRRPACPKCADPNCPGSGMGGVIIIFGPPPGFGPPGFPPFPPPPFPPPFPPPPFPWD